MAGRYEYELEVTASSAKNLKNVNWRHGPTRPYAVLWADPNNKWSTLVDDERDANPIWNQTLVMPLPPGPIRDATFYIDVVHAGFEEGTKPLIGSARLMLRDVLDEAGFGKPLGRSLQLERPSGRPHGKVEVRVCVRNTGRYRAPPYGVPPAYGNPHVPPQPPAGGYGVYNGAPPPLPQGNPYGNPHAPPRPPAGGYGVYNGPPPQPAYGNPYGNPRAPPQPPVGGYGAYSGEPPHYVYGREPAPPPPPPPPPPPQYRAEEERSRLEGMYTAMGVGFGVGLGLGLGVLGPLAGLGRPAFSDSSEDENDEYTDEDTDEDSDEDSDEDGIVVEADEIVDDGPAEEESNYED